MPEGDRIDEGAASSGAFACRGGRMLAKRGYVATGVALYALSPAVIALAASSGVYPLAVLLLHCILFGSLSIGYGLRSIKDARFEEGELRVDARGVTLGQRILVGRGELVQAFVMPTDAGTLVRLERRRGLPIIVRVPSEEAGRAMLRSLGFDAAHAAAEMRIVTGLAAMSMGKQMGLMLPPLGFAFAVMFGSIGLLQQNGMPAFMAALTLLLTYVMGIAFLPMRVRVGTDGIVTRWLGRPRFISFADVSDVSIYDELTGGKQRRGVRLVLRTGEEVKLPTGQSDIGKSEANRLAERIEEARRARREGASQPVADLLGRSARTASEWVRELRRLGAGAHDLRTSAVPVDVLMRVVEDSQQPAALRASAAVAVLSSDRADARDRVRIAADTSASPKLRIALERITSAPEDEAAIAAALGELEEVPKKLSRRA